MQDNQSKVINNLSFNFIGKKIKSLRDILKLSQKELAEKTDVSRSTISQMEIGTHLPSIESISKIAKILSVPYEYFLEESFEIVYKNGRFVSLKEEDIPDKIKDLIHQNELLSVKIIKCENELKDKEKIIKLTENELSRVEEKLAEYSSKKKDVS